MSNQPIKPAAPGDRPRVAKHTAGIADEDENIIVAFVPVDPKTRLNR
jgi:hypothetical protein